jgi:hypothetical protein
MKNKKINTYLGAIILLFNIFTFWLYETDANAGDLIINGIITQKKAALVTVSVTAT